MPNVTSSRRLRAICLTLATVIVLAAGIVPACDRELCCPVTPDVPIAHAEMPCCEAGVSNAPREITRVRPATFPGFDLTPHAATPAAVVAFEAPTARIELPHDTRFIAHREPSPPLFLLNAQFLI